MKYNGVIEKKLLVIEEKVNLIEEWNINSFTMLNDNLMLQNAVEHALQIAIEAIIDTSERILALEKQTPANSSADALNKLQELGIIAKNPVFADMVKFRNFIVHRYEKMDLTIIYAIIKKQLYLFREFVADIRNND